MKETDQEKELSAGIYQTLEENENYWRIPGYMHGGLVRYIVHGISPGDFLGAVINNDLREAVGRADDRNINAIPYYVRFFYNEAPSGSWGRPGAVAEWCRRINEDKDSRQQAQDSLEPEAQTE